MGQCCSIPEQKLKFEEKILIRSSTVKLNKKDEEKEFTNQITKIENFYPGMILR